MSQSRMDAEADAEQLRSFLQRHPAIWTRPDLWTVLDAVYAAQHHAPYIKRAKYPKCAADSGRAAARAAFRAIPGLRA
jgi:hypothetical protein